MSRRKESTLLQLEKDRHKLQSKEEKQDSSDTENKKEFRTLRERFDYEHGNRRTIY